MSLVLTASRLKGGARPAVDPSIGVDTASLRHVAHTTCAQRANGAATLWLYGR